MFVSANEKLGKFIKSAYGVEYDKLHAADKVALATEIGNKLDITKLTDAINQGQIKATELAFTVDGDISGVLPQHAHIQKISLLNSIRQRLHQVGDNLMGKDTQVGYKESAPAVSVVGAEARPAEQVMIVPEKPTKSFVERTGRTPMRAGMSHVERLADNSTSQTLATQR